MRERDTIAGVKTYLDNNATTRVDPAVIDAMAPFWTETYGNASSLHEAGRIAEDAVARAASQVASAIGGRPDEIIFTSGGTESDNLAIFGCVERPAWDEAATKPPHIITTAIEHPAVLNASEELEKRGVEATYLRARSVGIIDPADLGVAIREETALVSIMLANNETGAVQPVKEAATLVQGHDVLFHTDAVQAIGKIPVDVGDLGVDLLSLTAHKVHGPKGVGALWVRRGVRIEPQIFGGNHQHGRRPGTLAVPLIVGLGEAITRACDDLDVRASRMEALSRRVVEGIEERLTGFAFNGWSGARTPNTVNVEIDGVSGEALLIQLDQAGIEISTGSACASGSALPSHVLTAMGLSRRRAQSSLRISLSAMSTEEDVDHLLDVLPRCVERQRAMRVRRRRR